ncbi:MAG: aldo/keto reductase [Candidatus Microthrix parvicella]
MVTATSSLSFPGSSRSFAPLGVGTWAWGDKSTWGMGGYDTEISEATIAEAFDASLEAGVTLFDTAEVYGDGESERIIGRLLKGDPARRERALIATKFMPAPWKLNVRTALRSALEASLERLGVDRVDLYQLHGPVSLRSHSALADALAEVVEAKLCDAVGVSNYSIGEMGSIHAQLAARGVPLSSNQIEYSLLRRRPETTGLIEACRRLGVVPLAYSPIGQGRLTGKYSAANPPPKERTFSAHPMEQVDRITAELARIGEPHDRTPAQVSLAWLIAKGAVPIPGAKNAEQASQNAGALGWSLTPEELEVLDGLALSGQRTISQRIWQHG